MTVSLAAVLVVLVVRIFPLPAVSQAMGRVALLLVIVLFPTTARSVVSMLNCQQARYRGSLVHLKYSPSESLSCRSQ